MEMLEFVMKWAVAPVMAIVFAMYNRQQSHATDIAVLKATASANKEAHDREFRQIQASFQAVFDKLSTIEEALRK
jgi:tRNA A-37 threonylcarbamoyl transferase component Bud32